MGLLRRWTDRKKFTYGALKPSYWFLTADERGNTHTELDSRHTDGLAWSTGNNVRALIHGALYFRELLTAVESMGAGDRLMFTDWRGDADERLDGAGTEIAAVFVAAIHRGVDVRGLLWRSHFDKLHFSAKENRRLGDEIEAAGGQCLLDMRVRRLGSHHQKLVLLRHADHPERDIAFIGGIDLCHGRRDDHNHSGDLQSIEMAKVYGGRPPWHDIQLAIQGPAVGDAETVFRERWNDPSTLTPNPVQGLGRMLRREDPKARPLPAQLADPPPCGTAAVQILRTYPKRRPAYPFAPDGEMSVARGYSKALKHARSLIYVEDQYMWSRDVARVFASALEREPELRMIVIIPGFPDQDGKLSLPPYLLGREPAMAMLEKAGGSRVAFYSLENSSSVPIYVHAKICVVDDTWSCIGSDNANRRSWTYDSELSAAVLDMNSHHGDSWAKSVRLELVREHLGENATLANLSDPIETFEIFKKSAQALDFWHANGGHGLRPAGRLRTYSQPAVNKWTKLWAMPIYRLLYDPDGRTIRKRLRHQF